MLFGSRMAQPWAMGHEPWATSHKPMRHEPLTINNRLIDRLIENCSMNKSNNYLMNSFICVFELFELSLKSELWIIVEHHIYWIHRPLRATRLRSIALRHRFTVLLIQASRLMNGFIWMSFPAHWKAAVTLPDGRCLNSGVPPATLKNHEISSLLPWHPKS